MQNLCFTSLVPRGRSLLVFLFYLFTLQELMVCLECRVCVHDWNCQVIKMSPILKELRTACDHQKDNFNVDKSSKSLMVMIIMWRKSLQLLLSCGIVRWKQRDGKNGRAKIIDGNGCWNLDSLFTHIETATRRETLFNAKSKKKNYKRRNQNKTK